MIIHVYTKDQLEAQGIKWVIQTHISGTELKTFTSVECFTEANRDAAADLVILDMDGWDTLGESFEEWLSQSKCRWIGLSSERIFQTAYRGLRFRAEDVLFRPFSPEELIKHIQQLRYEIRNEKKRLARENKSEEKGVSINYPDFFLGDKKHGRPITMAAFLTPKTDHLQAVYDMLENFPFTYSVRNFSLSKYILSVHQGEDELLQEQYHSFLRQWKERTDEPLAIVIHASSAEYSLKETYEYTKQLTDMIFFEGYDIILVEKDELIWKPFDPFLTPLEQRDWIEMLEKRDTKTIRSWVEHQFLTYRKPYPDPEMVRVRITSVLAQVRRYMKSRQIDTGEWENMYHEVFQHIVRKPVLYEIVQSLLAFVTRLLTEGRDHLEDGPQTFVEKVKSMIESNYWNPQWNLAACADTLRMNKSTLSRRFSKESGRSFRDTLHDVRIREAKRMLKETDLSLEEIARLVGYSHQTYFNAKFKQIENKTPSAYRMGL